MILLIDIKGLEAAVEAAALAGQPQAQAWMQQSINRAGNWTKGQLAKSLQRSIPVKLKYIRRRIAWRNTDKTGLPGRLRVYGAGRDKSAFIRPRHMALTGANLARSLVRKGSSNGRGQVVQYGVGGPFPETAARTVTKGFVASVHAGSTFRMAGSHLGFDRRKSMVFERVGKARLPITAHQGITLGTAAARLNLAPVIERRLGERALREFSARLERELAAAVAKGVR